MNRIAKNTLFVAMMLTGMVLALPSIAPVAAKPAASTYHIDLWYDNSGHYSSQEAAFTLLVKLQLEKTGYFDVTLHTTDWSTFGSQIGTMPTFMLGWFYDYFDESNYIIPFEQTGYGLGTNYANATMDGYINTMLQTSDPTVRANAIKDAQAQMVADPVVIPLVTRPPPLVAYSDAMNGIFVQPSDNLMLGNMSKTAATSFTLGTTGSIGSSSSAIDFSGCYSFDCSFPLKQMTHGIFELDPLTSEAVPGPATQSWKVSPDGLNYTFNFDTSKTFTDGTNLRPEDVAWSLNRSIRLRDTAGGPSALLQQYNSTLNLVTGGVTQIKVLNSTAISVVLKDRDGTFPQRLAYTNAFIFKEDATYTYGPGGVTDNTTYGGNTYLPVGLGPYYINGPSDFVLNTELTLTMSKNYNSGPQPKNNVTIQFFGSSQALTTALQSNSVDVGYHTFTADDIDTITADPNINVQTQNSGFFIRYLVINIDSHPSIAVRQAMTYALDRQEMVDVIFAGKNAPLYSMVPSGFPLACKLGDTQNGKPCAYPQQNNTRVGQLMQSAGYTGNFQTVTQTNTATETGTATKTIVSSDVSTTTVSPGFEIGLVAMSLASTAVIWIKTKRKKFE
jgi:ABC-type transport system substrate-binding protein